MALNCDAADLPQASVADDPSEHFLNAWCPRCRQVIDATCPECHGLVEAAGASTDGAAARCLTRAEYYRRFLQLLQTSRNAKFTLGCYLIATGDAFADGVSMQDYARHWGVKRATVLKHCALICSALRLRPSCHML